MNPRAAFCICITAAAVAGSALAQGYKPYRPYAVAPDYNPYKIDKDHPERPPKNPYALPKRTGAGLTPTVSAADETTDREIEKYNHQYDPPTYRPPPAYKPPAPHRPPATYGPQPSASYNKPSGGPNARCYFSTCR